MEFSIATLLANFTDDKLVAPKVLEKKLGCQDRTTLRKLQIALDALEKIGILVKDKGRYRRAWDDNLVEAKLRCSSKGFCFAIQDKEGTEDIYIRECHLSNAWNGDRVLVNIIKEGSRRRSPEGEVRLILERSNPSVLARVKQEGPQYKAVPLDDRLLFELDIKANGVELEKAIEHLVHVEVVRYALGPYPPLGRVAQILGSDAEEANDLDIVCCKHDLPRLFADVAHAEIDSLPKQLRKADLKNRLDLRKVETIAILPQAVNGSDRPLVERAFTIESLKDNKFRLGIHVCDAAFYIKPDTALDREARKRGTTVHLGETILPLLPDSLARDRCSFLPGEDRLAISILIVVDEDANAIEYEIQPSVVHLDRYVTNAEADPILQEMAGHTELQGIPEWWRDVQQQQYSSEKPEAISEEIAQMLEQLFALSYSLQQRRRENGAFELNLPPNQYGICPSPYQDEGIQGVVSACSHLNTEGMLSEFIILANHLVALHVQELGVPAVYRVQPPPDLDEVEDLIKLASNMGVEILLDDEEDVTSVDYQDFTEVFAASTCERVLTYLLESTLKPTAYSTIPSSHFGLAMECYTHCNSPLQRYPDLLMQRLLHAVFDIGRDRKSTRSKDRVNLHHSSCHGQITWNVLPPDVHHEFESDFSSVVGHLTEREKLVQEAEADLEGLKKAGLMKERTGETFQGLITGVQSYGFFVEIEVDSDRRGPLRLEGLVHVSSLKDDWYEYRRQQTLVGRKNRKQYSLGDWVEVQVKSVDYYRQQIDLVAVGGGSEAPSTDDDIDYRPRDRNYDYEDDED
ncbi:VacB/RNase II family 3'-5' exoribonuclease [Oxynema sp. CENA135]|uniref:ribonuclease R family protein n=1 Tax=Oxynema sp. CENA135 TaxID=984206 RepID=UPI001909227E|nr:ribonuclease R family protein [Oxynema sp. CENA135]MBK4731871.1 VacB/RNase II family 3'-5' exoribonuclease [Oxynema sp. CENA135]